MSWRENLAGGCILKRACLCADNSNRARKIRPPHRVWPLLMQLSDPVGLLFSHFTKRNCDRIPKFTLAKIQFPDARKYSSKVFRRVSTQKHLLCGNSIDVINGSGGRRGSVLRSYGDIEMDHAFRIAKALMAPGGSDSSDDGDAKRPNYNDRKRRRKWRSAHVIFHRFLLLC